MTGKVAIICLFSVVFTANLWSAPKYLKVPELVELGEVESLSRTNHIFSCLNISNISVRIVRIQSSCGCTAVHPPDEPILPGKPIDLKVSYKAGNHNGVQTKSIWIYLDKDVDPIKVPISAKVIGGKNRSRPPKKYPKLATKRKKSQPTPKAVNIINGIEKTSYTISEGKISIKWSYNDECPHAVYIKSSEKIPGLPKVVEESPITLLLPETLGGSFYISIIPYNTEKGGNVNLNTRNSLSFKVAIPENNNDSQLTQLVIFVLMVSVGIFTLIYQTKRRTSR